VLSKIKGKGELASTYTHKKLTLNHGAVDVENTQTVIRYFKTDFENNNGVQIRNFELKILEKNAHADYLVNDGVDKTSKELRDDIISYSIISYKDNQTSHYNFFVITPDRGAELSL